MRVLFRHEK